MLTAVAEVDDGYGLVLNPTGAHVDVRQLAGELAGHRLLLPLTVTTSRQMRRQAEELSLLGDNVYVQVPVMTAGQFNTALIHDLLAEGVPLAVTGLATRQAVKRVLDQAVASQTPLLLMMSAATAYYDLIVSTALAHLFPTVQLVVGAPNQLAILPRPAPGRRRGEHHRRSTGDRPGTGRWGCLSAVILTKKELPSVQLRSSFDF